MAEPNSTPRDQQPLPLFRPEALAAQAQTYYGEILLIRPFSLAVFFWLAIGISALVLGFLLLGTVTERARVSGVVLGRQGDAYTAELFLPARVAQSVHPEQSVQLLCQSCPGDSPPVLSGKVNEVSNSPVSPEEVPRPQDAGRYKAIVTLHGPPNGDASLPVGAQLKGDLPGGRKRLWSWLFDRSSPNPSRDDAGAKPVP